MMGEVACFRMRRWLPFGSLTILMTAAGWAELPEAFEGSADHPAIGYSQPAHDPVAELNQKLQEGKVELRYDKTAGYLRSVLEALRIPIESQVVAYSKTSVQSRRINPKNPRSLFFNDSVVVGWVNGGFIELAAQDPKQGIIFYTLGKSVLPGLSGLTQASSNPYFERSDSCLQCHLSYATLGIPGMLLRSVYPDTNGSPQYQAGSFITDHRLPIKQRWGGWYVTGREESVVHLGNGTIADMDHPEVMESELALESLNSRFDTNLYLSPYSDIAALMVFDHQMRMMNLLTRVNWEARYELYEHPTSLSTRLKEAANEFVDYLLFIDEAPIEAPIHGASGFAEKFSAQDPRDQRGRSFRQLDLKHRLLKYPCSYMIYSDAFEGLPSEAKEAVYRRMWEILSGQEEDAKYAKLTRADRQAVIEILRDTKKDLPDYFTRTSR
jgi:hypothetical protein